MTSTEHMHDEAMAFAAQQPTDNVRDWIEAAEGQLISWADVYAVTSAALAAGLEDVPEYDGPTVLCWKHGPAYVTEEGTYTGFAGGSCTWTQLSCGCWDGDESDDLRAAQ